MSLPVTSPAPVPALEAARERVVRLLTDRYADDSLTVEAFEAQLDRMHALASVEALDAMARELAAPATLAVAAAAPMAVAPHLPRRVDRLAGVLPGRLRAFLSSTKRSGAWVVPPQMRVTSVMSEIVLDLRAAVLPPVCELEVLAFMGNLTLRLPPGVEALVDVEAVMASVSDRGHERPVARGGPLVRVTGQVIMGEVKVRREDW